MSGHMTPPIVADSVDLTLIRDALQAALDTIGQHVTLTTYAGDTKPAAPQCTNGRAYLLVRDALANLNDVK